METGPKTVKRNTRQKTAIMEYLQKAKKEYCTADDLFDDLRQRGTPVSRATIYRCLAALEEAEQVRRYAITAGENASACYEYIGDAPQCRVHYHLMCTGCGRVVHFQDASLQQALAGLLGRQGITVEDEKTVLYGKCRACGGGIQC